MEAMVLRSVFVRYIRSNAALESSPGLGDMRAILLSMGRVHGPATWALFFALRVMNKPLYWRENQDLAHEDSVGVAQPRVRFLHELQNLTVSPAVNGHGELPECVSRLYLHDSRGSLRSGLRLRGYRRHHLRLDRSILMFHHRHVGWSTARTMRWHFQSYRLNFAGLLFRRGERPLQFCRCRRQQPSGFQRVPDVVEHRLPARETQSGQGSTRRRLRGPKLHRDSGWGEQVRSGPSQASAQPGRCPSAQERPAFPGGIPGSCRL